MLRALSHLHVLRSKSCGSQAICTYWFQNVAQTVQSTDFISTCYEHPTVYRFFASERREHHSTVFIYDAISCKIMECADVCIALLQILSDGKAPCNELMLHHAMQCTGASCRMLQIPSKFVADSMQLRDPSSKQPTYGTPILSHGAFTKT